jgi:hypothetical protein
MPPKEVATHDPEPVSHHGVKIAESRTRASTKAIPRPNSLRSENARTGTGLNGFEPTISVDDLDAVIAAVEGHGGRITMPKSGIPTVGILVRFEDTEGDDVGAMKYETPPRQ